jgi:hypothetical protein
MQFSCRCIAETLKHALDSRVRGDFTKIVAAHSVGEHEEPAVRAHALGPFGDHVP